MRRTVSRHVAAVQALTLAIGLIAVLFAAVAGKPGSIAYTALLSLGIALFTTTVIAWIGRAFGTDALALMEERLGVQRAFHDAGLREIQLKLENEDYLKDLVRANSVDAMHATGFDFVNRHASELAEALRARRCIVRILLTHPDNPYLRSDVLSDALCPHTNLKEEIPGVLRRLTYLIENTVLCKGSSIEVRGYDCVPPGRIVIVNNEVARYTPYLPYAHAIDVPAFDVARSHGPGLLNQYQDTFERIWNNSRRLLPDDSKSSVDVQHTAAELAG